MNEKHLGQILHRAGARYLKVSPQGLHIADEVLPAVQARILAWSPARTLYRDKRPICRSLDGVVSITHTERRCEPCDLNSQCTVQVRIDLLIGGRAYRLLLAYTSASNFLVYAADLSARNLTVDDVEHRLHVVDRGHFGEVRFSRLWRRTLPPLKEETP
jgi:hypothetical protein